MCSFELRRVLASGHWNLPQIAQNTHTWPIGQSLKKIALIQRDHNLELLVEKEEQDSSCPKRRVEDQVGRPRRAATAASPRRVCSVSLDVVASFARTLVPLVERRACQDALYLYRGAPDARNDPLIDQRLREVPDRCRILLRKDVDEAATVIRSAVPFLAHRNGKLLRSAIGRGGV
jgi:hypothetical protein